MSDKFHELESFAELDSYLQGVYAGERKACDFAVFMIKEVLADAEESR